MRVNFEKTENFNAQRAELQRPVVLWVDARYSHFISSGGFLLTGFLISRRSSLPAGNPRTSAQLPLSLLGSFSRNQSSISPGGSSVGSSRDLRLDGGGGAGATHILTVHLFHCISECVNAVFVLTGGCFLKLEAFDGGANVSMLFVSCLRWSLKIEALRGEGELKFEGLRS